MVYAYVIQNVNGLWWTGEDWGPKNARVLYGRPTIPVKLEDNLSLYYDLECGYYYAGKFGCNPQASLMPVEYKD
jgi:hypothetical protein